MGKPSIWNICHYYVSKFCDKTCLKKCNVEMYFEIVHWNINMYEYIMDKCAEKTTNGLMETMSSHEQWIFVVKLN